MFLPKEIYRRYLLKQWAPYLIHQRIEVCFCACYISSTVGKSTWCIWHWRQILYVCNETDDMQIQFVACLLACLMSQQHASVSQGQTCSDKFTCRYTETEVADQTFYLTQSQYTDTGPTSPSTDPITPGAWQGSHWSVNFYVTSMTRPGKMPTAQAGIEPRICRILGGCLNH